MQDALEGFIRTGWLIDGSGDPVLKNRIMDIRKGVIRSIRQTIPAGVGRSEILDLSGHTILPALIDSHVHLFMSGTSDPQRRRKQLDAGYDENPAGN